MIESLDRILPEGCVTTHGCGTVTAQYPGIASSFHALKVDVWCLSWIMLEIARK
jgi:hypothetical protein